MLFSPSQYGSNYTLLLLPATPPAASSAWFCFANDSLNLRPDFESLILCLAISTYLHIMGKAKQTFKCGLDHYKHLKEHSRQRKLYNHWPQVNKKYLTSCGYSTSWWVSQFQLYILELGRWPKDGFGSTVRQIWLKPHWLPDLYKPHLWLVGQSDILELVPIQS